MTCTVRRQGAPTSADMLPLIVKLDVQGLSPLEIADRTGLSRRTVANALQRWHEQQDEDAPLPPRSTLPRRLGLQPVDHMPPPPSGREGLPGYDAWEMMHAQKLDVRTVMRRLGLRYPSEVFDLLAQHKAALEAEAGALSATARKNAMMSENSGLTGLQTLRSRDAAISSYGEHMLLTHAHLTA